MRTNVEIIARAGSSGGSHRASGALSVRQTGRDRVHLVGAAAHPVGGDDTDIRIVVEAGARLTVTSVAASIALPSRDRVDSRATWHIEVAPGGTLLLDPEPTVVAGGAEHLSEVFASVAADGNVVIVEHVQIGRSSVHREKDLAGRWSGVLHVDVDGRPLLRHRIELGRGSVAAAAGHHAASSIFRRPDIRPAYVAANDFAARMSLSGGGSLTNVVAATVAQTRRLCDDLDLAALAH
ncbi:MAG: urease accessory protein UreD [Gordonia sp. (in: high G+C Gram-positive bacteria)]